MRRCFVVMYYVGGITAKNYGVIRNCGVNSLGYFFVGMDNSYVGGIGEDSGTIEDVYEPFLIQNGFLARTPRGRIVTEKTYHHLGLSFDE